MRLYLSSFRLGTQPARIVALVDGNKHAAVIVNACDSLTKGERNVRLQQEISSLEGIGLRAEEIDLRSYFDCADQHGLSNRLSKYGLVWIRGGNPFVLRRAMRASGFDEIIQDFLKRDALVYGGFSAGIAMLAPSLHGKELLVDPHEAPEGYDARVIWDCFGLLPYHFVPHYKSNHPISSQMDQLVQYYLDNRMLFKVLRDGEVIVVNGEQEEFLS